MGIIRNTKSVKILLDQFNKDDAISVNLSLTTKDDLFLVPKYSCMNLLVSNFSF